MKEIYYEIQGSGYPILLLHGNGGTHHEFDELVDKLKGQYQCISLDTRYHGQSVHCGELSYQQFAKDVMMVADDLSLSQFDLIGFSDGGITALLVSSQDSRVKHMVVMGANVRVWGIKALYRFNDYLNLFCLLPFCIYQKPMRLRFRLICLMERMKEIDQETLHKINIPTLIMAGERDMIKDEETQYIHENIKYSIKKIIKNGTHFLLGETFDETSQEIALFLEACHKEDNDENM